MGIVCAELFEDSDLDLTISRAPSAERRAPSAERRLLPKANSTV